MIHIWTDGSCKPNPGPGGWCALLRHRNRVRVLTGSLPQTTNNVMELTAAVEALKALRHRCVVTLTTDSEYLRSVARRRDHTGRPNEALCRELSAVVDRHSVRFEWVSRNLGIPENRYCDRMAARARLGRRAIIMPTVWCDLPP